MVILLIASACSVESALDDATCENDEDCEPYGICAQGWCVAVDGDTHPPPDDADTSCVPETDTEFCMRLGAECGVVDEQDNCLQPRQVSCGELDGFGCASALMVCDDENRCACPAIEEVSAADLCQRAGAECDTISPASLCPEWTDAAPVDCGTCPEEDCGDVLDNVCGCPCLIDGDCYAPGEASNDYPCRICDPEKTDDQFSHAPEGSECGDNAHCRDGHCICDESYKDCADRCVDVDSNPDHCGECHRSCAESCVDGKCVCQGDGVEQCGQHCVDLRTNDNHCGSCNRSCGIGEVCSDGSCICDEQQGYENCGGQCINTDHNTHHCGDCFIQCGPNDGCLSGECHCFPQCSGRECGPDGCNGDCGSCTGCQSCSADGSCVDDDTQCDPGESCSNGQCECIPQCTGLTCQQDGCGGYCECTAPGAECCGTDCCDPSDCCDGTCCSTGTCCNGNCCSPGEICVNGECSPPCDPPCADNEYCDGTECQCMVEDEDGDCVDI